MYRVLLCTEYGMLSMYPVLVLHPHYRFHMAVLKSPKLPHQCINSQEPGNSRTGHRKAMMRDFES